MPDASANIDKGSKKSSIDELPLIKEGRNRIYDPQNQQIVDWLSRNWVSGYNPLAADHAYYSNVMRLTLPDGQIYNYSEPNHSFEHYRQNVDEQLPNFLVHITQAGWVEYAINASNAHLGKDDGIWTGAHDPRRWWGGKFPDNFSFTKPPDRFVELMFDAQKLRQMGFEGNQVKGTDYYHFKSRIPLIALVPTSKAYLSQVLGFAVPGSIG